MQIYDVQYTMTLYDAYKVMPLMSDTRKHPGIFKEKDSIFVLIICSIICWLMLVCCFLDGCKIIFHVCVLYALCTSTICGI